jgi:hypothetical protein
MATGIFVGLDKKQILAIQARAIKFFMEGKTSMSYSDAGTSVSKQFVMSPDMVMDECNYALRRLEGRVRGLYTNYNRIVDR